MQSNKTQQVGCTLNDSHTDCFTWRRREWRLLTTTPRRQLSWHRTRCPDQNSGTLYPTWQPTDTSGSQRGMKDKSETMQSSILTTSNTKCNCDVWFDSSLSFLCVKCAATAQCTWREKLCAAAFLLCSIWSPAVHYSWAASQWIKVNSLFFFYEWNISHVTNAATEAQRRGRSPSQLVCRNLAEPPLTFPAPPRTERQLDMLLKRGNKSLSVKMFTCSTNPCKQKVNFKATSLHTPRQIPAAHLDAGRRQAWSSLPPVCCKSLQVRTGPGGPLHVPLSPPTAGGHPCKSTSCWRRSSVLWKESFSKHTEVEYQNRVA